MSALTKAKSLPELRTVIGERLTSTTIGRADELEVWAGAHLAALAAESYAADTYDEADWMRCEHLEALAVDAVENTEAALKSATRNAANRAAREGRF